jgi:hypothetical protein
VRVEDFRWNVQVAHLQAPGKGADGGSWVAQLLTLIEHAAALMLVACHADFYSCYDFNRYCCM